VLPDVPLNNEQNLYKYMICHYVQLVKSFMEELHKLQVEIDQNNVPVQWNTAVKFIMARKFDLHRALDLYRNHEVWNKLE